MNTFRTKNLGKAGLRLDFERHCNVAAFFWNLIGSDALLQKNIRYPIHSVVAIVLLVLAVSAKNFTQTFSVSNIVPVPNSLEDHEI